MQPLLCAAGVVGPALGPAAELGRWFVGVAVFACLGRVPEEEAALSNHSAQSPAYKQVASARYAMGHCKVKCSLGSVQQVRWGLH